MASVTDKAELKPGLVLTAAMWSIARRTARMKIPKADRYKTVSLKATDIDVTRGGDGAGLEGNADHGADVRPLAQGVQGLQVDQAKRLKGAWARELEAEPTGGT
ncbi:MAG: hypothetical protein PW792_10565 [Acidobacteriaceae bacterium]|nr:hypothetical protein [Acidobacteriaceae bacterium]